MPAMPTLEDLDLNEAIRVTSTDYETVLRSDTWRVWNEGLRSSWDTDHLRQCSTCRAQPLANFRTQFPLEGAPIPGRAWFDRVPVGSVAAYRVTNGTPESGSWIKTSVNNWLNPGSRNQVDDDGMHSIWNNNRTRSTWTVGRVESTMLRVTNADIPLTPAYGIPRTPVPAGIIAEFEEWVREGVRARRHADGVGDFQVILDNLELVTTTPTRARNAWRLFLAERAARNTSQPLHSAFGIATPSPIIEEVPPLPAGVTQDKHEEWQRAMYNGDTTTERLTRMRRDHDHDLWSHFQAWANPEIDDAWDEAHAERMFKDGDATLAIVEQASPEDRESLGRALATMRRRVEEYAAESARIAERNRHLESELTAAKSPIEDGGDERLIPFWRKAATIASDNDFCGEYDRMAEAMNGLRRDRSWTVNGSITVTIPFSRTVTATDEETATNEASSYLNGLSASDLRWIDGSSDMTVEFDTDDFTVDED